MSHPACRPLLNVKESFAHSAPLIPILTAFTVFLLDKAEEKKNVQTPRPHTESWAWFPLWNWFRRGNQENAQVSLWSSGPWSRIQVNRVAIKIFDFQEATIVRVKQM